MAKLDKKGSFPDVMFLNIIARQKYWPTIVGF